ncbi:hypothetical protein GF319_15655 [Candidatus Bathyarchaeota archaeon]|nr:hypothetical protein [Candidatus Bathyarchaeota archaeon]
MEQNRSYIIILGLILVVVIVFGVYIFLNRPSPQAVSIKESFEEGSPMWIPNSDVPMDPNNPGQPVNWTIVPTQEVVFEGSYAAQFFLDGSQDDGTIWLEQEVTLNPNTEYEAELSFQFWSASESFNQLAYVVGQVSPEDLEAEEDFADLGAANLVEGWREYNYTVTFTTNSDGVVHVGFGVSVVWETEIVYFIDNVEVSITPT